VRLLADLFLILRGLVLVPAFVALLALAGVWLGLVLAVSSWERRDGEKGPDGR
jgi:hypothetical protein